MKIFYSVNEAAEATSLSRRTIYNLIQRQAIETRKIGTRTVIPAGSLHNLPDRAA